VSTTDGGASPVTFLPTDLAPAEGAHKVGDLKPDLLLTQEHDMCPGCGEPLVVRILLETLAELGIANRTITLDLDLVQALHGRAPSLATGVKRMLPESVVFTLQGDGDMVNEGLQEAIHTAARGEAITCVLLNNGVFGETGGHMTATTVIGQRTKNTLEGRDPAYHGFPIRIGDLLAQLDGSAYVARGSVHSAGAVAKTKKMLHRAFETQLLGGFSFVEVLTMCPTGWFVPTADGPGYMDSTLGQFHTMGELKGAG
jgi:2-oxoglutarate ferredoxin oxidoreductase subunit beta